MRKRWVAVNLILLGASLIAITIVARLSGGAHSIAIQFYYLPIIWAGYLLGDVGALFAALVAAFLAGPVLLPETMQDVGGDTPLTYGDIILPDIVRTLFFFVIGMASSRIGYALRRRATEFETLYEVAHTVSSSLRLEAVLNLIVQSAMKVMAVRACSLRLLTDDKERLELRAADGLSADYLKKGHIQVAESPVDERVLRGESVALQNVGKMPGFQYSDEAAKEGLTSVLTVPLISKDEPLGVIRVYALSERRFVPDEVALLEAFANQASVAIENASLYEDIRRNYYETVRALTVAIEARDPVTYGHSERVTEIAQRFAGRLELVEDDKEYLRFATVLHDIGKIGVDTPSLDLNMDFGEAANFDMQMFYQMHPIIGRSILQPVEFLQRICPVVLYHHEHWDGSGFPENLAGEDIPYEARLVAIVDAYDHLVYGSDGQGGIHPTDAFAVIEAQSGARFDPVLAKQFLKLRPEEIARFTLGEGSQLSIEATDV